MEKILVPTDFTLLAEKALIAAVDISRKTKASIELLHVIDSPTESDFAATGDTIHGDKFNDLFMLKSIELARKKLHSIVNNVNYVGVRFSIKIKSGTIHHHLSEAIVKEKIDLIVMGTNGSSGIFKGIFNRSNTEAVVMNAHCMVLTIKEGQKDLKIRKVMFATDFKDNSPIFIENLKMLQSLFEFKFHIVYVNALINHKQNLSEVISNKDAFVKKFNLRDYEFHILEDFSEYSGILEYAQANNIDVICLSTHQRKGFWHWVGGVSEDLVNFANVPVLTYQAES